MEPTLLIIIAVLLLIAIVLIIVFRNKSNNDFPILQTKVGELQSSLYKIETNLKDDFRINREENSANAKTNRDELNKAIGDFRTEIMTAVKTMTDQNNTALEKLNQTLEQKVTALIDKNDKSFKTFTDGNTTQLEKIEKKVEENLKALNEQAKTDNNLMREAFVDQLRDEYKIIVAGPTTLMATLNSLQIGFHTLGLHKRSNEVWDILSSVKQNSRNLAA